MIRPILLNIPIKPHLYKKGHVEKDFESDVFRHLRSHGYFCYHISDIGYSTKMLDGIIIDPDGKTFYIEFKKMDGFTFNLSQFEPSQIILLELMMKRNVEAWIMVYSKKTQTYWIGTYEFLKSQANSVGGIKLF